LLQSAGALIVTASAQSPAAVVEEIQGSVPGIQFMDYVDPGQVIRLGAHDRIVLGYLKSCWRETISGGTVTVGIEQSEVAGGEVARAKVACEGGKMMLSAELAGKSGAMVFRQAPKPQASPPSRIRNSRSLDCARSSKCGRPASLLSNAWISPANATRSPSPSNNSCAAHSWISPSRAWRSFPAESTGLNSPTRRLCSKIDPDAKPGEAPLVGRLARLQARR